MKRGELVPDALVINLIAERLDEDRSARGFILTDFPAPSPGRGADRLFKERGKAVDRVVVMEVDDERSLRVLPAALHAQVVARATTMFTRPRAWRAFAIAAAAPNSRGARRQRGGGAGAA